MPTVSLSSPSILQFLNNSGQPNAGGTLLTQVGGVNVATYQDAAGTISLPNPIPLNARGEVSNSAGVSCQLFLVQGSTYTFTLFDPIGNQINQAASVSGPNNLSLTTNLAASSGALLVGFLPTGIGAVATTVQDALSTFKHLSTGQFFSNLGARVDRLTDRIFIGDSAKHTGADAIPQADWLTNYELARGRAGGSLMYSTAGISNDSGTRAANTLMVGAQAVNLLAFYNAIAIRSLAANNSTLSTINAYSGYFEVYRNIGATGGAYGIEIDTINYASVIEVDPYQQLSGQTIALQIAGGGQFPSTGQFASSAAINIRNNGSTYERGIVFGSDALTGSNGVTGNAPAIVMGIGHGLLWYGSANISTSAIYCNGTTFLGGTTQNFAEGGVTFGNSSSGSNVFRINNALGAAGVNFPAVTNSISGNPVQFNAVGADANVDLQLVPKGTGAVWLGAYTAGVVTQAGYITVKDTSGVVRRLLVG